MSQQSYDIAARQVERRKYFRIDDEIYLEYSFLSQDQYNREIKSIRKKHTASSALNSLNELQAATTSVQSHIKRIKRRHPETARALQAINEKIDAAILAALTQNPDNKNEPRRTVNISASGIAFQHPHPVPAGTHAKMTIQLFPGYKTIELIARVVEYRTSADDGGILALHYEYISEADRNSLEEHILQTEMRRRQAAHKAV